MSSERVAGVLFGGLILGFWLYGLLFGYGDGSFQVGQWAMWGFMGFVVAGGVYGAKAASDTARLLIVALIGVVLALIITGAIVAENWYVWATVTTAAGAGLIFSALPTPIMTSSEPAHE